MIKAKFAVFATALVAASSVQAGGILTNTNQNISFNRNFARDGVIAIDGVYSNPAGVAFLGKGFHLSLNIQNVYQTRTIVSGMNVPAFKGTPYESAFYQPFKLNGGNEDGTKKFRGKASVPILPSFQAALNYDNWGFQLGFALNGGGASSLVRLTGSTSIGPSMPAHVSTIFGTNTKVISSTFQPPLPTTM